METSKRDFDKFISECKRWGNKFGLQIWELNLVHADSISFEDEEAWGIPSLEHMSVEIGLSKNWNDAVPVTDYEVRKAAFHEMDELRFCEIRENLERYYSKEFVNSMIHKIIRNDEEIIFDADYRRRYKKI